MAWGRLAGGRPAAAREQAGAAGAAGDSGDAEHTAGGVMYISVGMYVGMYSVMIVDM